MVDIRRNIISDVQQGLFLVKQLFLAEWHGLHRKKGFPRLPVFIGNFRKESRSAPGRQSRF
jgi:hypothetical protein